MAHDQSTPGIVANRLDVETLAENFSDPQGAFAAEAAVAEANRCLLCKDAPCVTACATHIDVPGFIRQIREGDTDAAARTIFDANILGGICSRVCPVDVLCEGACPIGDSDGGPIAIAQLQRYATDPVLAAPGHPYERATPSGKRVAIVGAGPASLSCAHKLARLGHDVVIFESKERAGGLNEYGIAAYKAPTGYARAEADWLMRIGGIEFHPGMHLGRDLTLDSLRESCDAVFLGLGLAGVNALRAEGEDKENVHDAIDFIAGLREKGWSELPIGRDVVVIGGGMTAVETAVQAKLLGAENVTLVYRRTEAEMKAYAQERLHASSKGVRIVTGAIPLRILGDKAAEGVEFTYVESDTTGLRPGGETFRIRADQVFKAIGQCLEDAPGGIRLEGKKIWVEGAGRTSLSKVWAGGDCAIGHSDLTVAAVAEGRAAAEDIDQILCAS